MSNSKIKVSELFYSIQGEGRYSGVPSVFLRTFGCNFRCKNFGRYGADAVPPTEKYNPEVATIINNLDKYQSYEQLPLVATGCDSYAAVYPEFKHISPLMSVEEIANNIMGMLPFGQWRDEHLVITGGEPLLGWQRSYPALLSLPSMQSLKEITFETNGTQYLTNEFKEYLNEWPEAVPGRAVTFSVSAKLSCSGETREEAILPEVVCQYQEAGYTYLKFVVATEDDVEEAIETIDIYRANGFTGPCYLMAVGGVESVYHLNNRRVADLAMKHGLRYSDRLQVPLFANVWGS